MSKPFRTLLPLFCRSNEEMKQSSIGYELLSSVQAISKQSNIWLACYVATKELEKLSGLLTLSRVLCEFPMKLRHISPGTRSMVTLTKRAIERHSAQIKV